MEVIEKAAKTLEDLRTIGLIFNEDIPTLDPFAQSEFLIALSHMEIATRQLEKVLLIQARAIAEFHGGART